MSKTVYPKGIVLFQPHDSAPDFVKGVVKININEFVQFCKDNQDLLTEYNGNKQLPLQLLSGNNGLYFTVDTYRPDSKGGGQGGSSGGSSEPTEGLPF